MKMDSKIKQKAVSSRNLKQQITKFEEDNPELVKAMNLFDLSMDRYEKALLSLEQSKTYTSNSTKIIQ